MRWSARAAAKSTDLWARLSAKMLAPMSATHRQDDRRKVLVHQVDKVESVDRFYDNFVSSTRSVTCIHKISAARAVLINGVIRMKEHWQKT